MDSLGFSPNIFNWAWQYTPLIPALRRQRQMNLCEFKASQVYIIRPSQIQRERQRQGRGEEMA